MSKEWKRPKRKEGEPWRETLATGKRQYNGTVPDKPRHAILDNDRRFNAPARARKRFEDLKQLFNQTVWGRPVVRPWEKHGKLRIYFPDQSYIYIDQTGAVRSTGGAATRAKLEHGLI